MLNYQRVPCIILISIYAHLLFDGLEISSSLSKCPNWVGVKSPMLSDRPMQVWIIIVDKQHDSSDYFGDVSYPIPQMDYIQ